MNVVSVVHRGAAILVGLIVATSVGAAMTSPPEAVAERVEPSPSQPEVSAAPQTAKHPPEDFAPGSLVSLTFDDGPSPELTPRILDILKEKKVKAAFFLQGSHVMKNPELVKRIQAEGHVIGNHSWSHTNFKNLSNRQAKYEIIRTNEAIKRVTGETPVLFRYPFGEETEAGNRTIRAEGMWGGILWHWDTQPGDYTCQGPEGTERYVVDNSVDQALILLHDGNEVVQCGSDQLAYLPAAIDALRAKGFELGIPVPDDGPSRVNENSWIKVVSAE